MKRTPRNDTLTFGHVLLALAVLLIALLGIAASNPPKAQAAPLSLERCAKIRGVHDRRACIIRVVFGRHGAKAVRVFYCESRLDPKARNGQYRGIAQMGSRERARYGHGRTVLAQALAARRYHRVAGWTPWTCAK